MTKSAIATLISALALMACTSQETVNEPSSQPIEDEADLQATPKENGLKSQRPCPEITDFSAYRNLMPGPGSQENRKRVSISFTAKDGEGWAVSEKPVEQDDTIRISLFPTLSQHVKPPARSLAPIKQYPGQDPSAARVARFRILKEGANRVEIYCGGEMIEETRIGAVH